MKTWWFIEGLKAQAVIGVFTIGKKDSQDLLFDWRMEHDNECLQRTDDLAKTFGL